MKEIDKINPSELTNFKKDVSISDIDINSEEIKIVFINEERQDIEHLYHNDLIEKHDKS